MDHVCFILDCGPHRIFLLTYALEVPEVASVPKELPVFDRYLFVLESNNINDIVHKHNAVIMGCGGFLLSEGRPETVHLFI